MRIDRILIGASVALVIGTPASAFLGSKRRDAETRDMAPVTFGNINMGLEVVFLNSALDASGELPLWRTGRQARGTAAAAWTCRGGLPAEISSREAS